MQTQTNRSIQTSARKRVALTSLVLCFVVFTVFQIYKLSAATISPIHQTPQPPHSAGTIYQPAAPVQLVIPIIGVDAKVETIGLTKATGALGVPKNFVDVGWYQNGPKPGTTGSAVIDGHYNGKHVAQGVFFKLGKLSVGDSVLVIDEHNQQLTFMVTKVKTFDYNESTEEVFASTSESHLNLITCAGDWLPSEHLFNKRTVVFTTLAQ